MSKNKIQRQKGLSLPKFLEQYGKEEDCRNRLLNFRWPQGYSCPQCGCETPPDSPADLCPDCLLRAGLEAADSREAARTATIAR